jgi:hypothetical protein
MPTKAFSHFTGGDVEFGTFTLDPASIAAASQGISTVTVTGAKVGDLVFVNAEALENRIAVVGAKVTATDTVSVYINNMFDSTTAVDGVSKTYSYMLVHMS